MESVKWNGTPSVYFLLIPVNFGLRDPGRVFAASQKTKTVIELTCAPSRNCLYSPYSDVKYVASNRAGHSHVPEPLPGHYDTGDKIRDGGPSSQDGQTHNLFTNANCLSNLKVMTGTHMSV